MGEKNSSLTRVQPLGKRLLENHPAIQDLLNLIPSLAKIEFGDFFDTNIFYKQVNPTRKEKSLPPSKDHLKKIIEKIADKPKMIEKAIKNCKTMEKREKMFIKDEDTLNEALEIINGGKRGKYQKWALLEAPSYPDLFVENDSYILLVEAKRTENATTKKVEYLENRSQMVRHIQNTINYNSNKKIIAFYIIEKDCKYKDACSKKAFKDEIEKETIIIDDQLKQKILDSFYGYIFWEDVGDKLRIDYTR